jgi:hypothetical protein
MLRFQRARWTIITAALVLAAGAARTEAVPVFYTDRATFLAAAGGGLSTEDFEVDFAVAPSIVFAGFTLSETGGVDAVGNVISNPGILDSAVTDGRGAAIYDDNGDSIGTFFSFTNPVTAFGVDLTTGADATVLIGGSVNTSVNRTANTPGFFGVIDTVPLTTISFDVSGGPNVGFDRAVFGLAVAVPEPATLTALLLGATGLLSRRRRG